MKTVNEKPGMQNCKECAVHSCSPFAGTSTEFLHHLEGFSENVTFKAGDLIYQAGSTMPRQLLCVRMGLAYDCTTLANGDRHIPRIHTPGAILPIWALSANSDTDQLPAVDVYALGDVSGCLVNADALHELSRNNTQVLQSYLNFVSHQLRHTNDQARFLRSTSAEERVRSFFGLMAKEYGPILKVERSLVATITDLTISSISRIITHFENNGWVRRHGWDIEIVEADRFKV